MPTDPGGRPEYIHALSQRLESDRHHTGCLLFIPLVPVKRDSRDAIALSQPVRPLAHSIGDDIGMISPEIPEHRLDRGVIADIARAEQAEQANPGSGRSPPTMGGEP